MLGSDFSPRIIFGVISILSVQTFSNSMMLYLQTYGLTFVVSPLSRKVCPFSDRQESSAESGVGIERIENFVRSQWVQHGKIMGSCRIPKCTNRNQQKPTDTNRSKFRLKIEVVVFLPGTSQYLAVILRLRGTSPPSANSSPEVIDRSASALSGQGCHSDQVRVGSLEFSWSLLMYQWCILVTIVTWISFQRRSQDDRIHHHPRWQGFRFGLCRPVAK